MYFIRLVKKALSSVKTDYDRLTEIKRVRDLFENLSKREAEVMGLVVNGKSNQDIAASLKISPKTVEIHRSRVMTKMKAKNVAELIQLSNCLEL